MTTDWTPGKINRKHCFWRNTVFCRSMSTPDPIGTITSTINAETVFRLRVLLWKDIEDREVDRERKTAISAYVFFIECDELVCIYSYSRKVWVDFFSSVCAVPCIHKERAARQSTHAQTHVASQPVPFTARKGQRWQKEVTTEKVNLALNKLSRKDFCT